MATINIQILRTDLDGLGVDQEPIYRPLNFDPGEEIVAYWTSEETGLMTVYLGPHEFICKWTKRNIDIFDKLIDDKVQKRKVCCLLKEGQEVKQADE